jgi:hypothetical protein
MPHKIEPSPSGRAACRACKKPIPKGVLRFGEEYVNQFTNEPAMAYRYFHLECAAAKFANEVADALASFAGTVPDREALDALIAQHLRPELPYAERASTGRARCRACDETIAKGELRLAFERTLETPMGPQKASAYAHARCAGRYLERERELGRGVPDREQLVRLLEAHSKLPLDDVACVRSEVLASAAPQASV